MGIFTIAYEDKKLVLSNTITHQGGVYLANLTIGKSDPPTRSYPSFRWAFAFAAEAGFTGYSVADNYGTHPGWTETLLTASRPELDQATSIVLNPTETLATGTRSGIFTTTIQDQIRGVSLVYGSASGILLASAEIPSGNLNPPVGTEITVTYTFSVGT